MSGGSKKNVWEEGGTRTMKRRRKKCGGSTDLEMELVAKSGGSKREVGETI